MTYEESALHEWATTDLPSIASMLSLFLVQSAATCGSKCMQAAGYIKQKAMLASAGIVSMLCALSRHAYLVSKRTW